MHTYNGTRSLITGQWIEATQMEALFGPRSQAAPHMTHYTKAMAFIQAHGHFAAITKDGLLALGTVWQAEMPIAMTDPTDDKVELPKVFEVDEAGMVPSRDVREWLGY